MSFHVVSDCPKPTLALTPAPTPSAAGQDLPDQGTGAPSAVSYALGGPRAIQPWLQGQLAVLNGVSGLPDRSASAISIGSTRPNCTACAPAPVRASTAFHAGPVITSVPARDRAAIQERTYPRRRSLAHFAVPSTRRAFPTTAPAPAHVVGATDPPQLFAPGKCNPRRLRGHDKPRRQRQITS